MFVACMPYSNYVFVMAVPSQHSDDFLYALGCCLNHMGGSPKIVVTDNLKASVVRADRYEPEINRIMEDFANHYGFAVVPTRVRKPRDKAAVENEVKIAYRRIYAKLRNRRFFSLEQVNAAFAEKSSGTQSDPHATEEILQAGEVFGRRASPTQRTSP